MSYFLCQDLLIDSIIFFLLSLGFGLLLNNFTLNNSFLTVNARTSIFHMIIFNYKKKTFWKELFFSCHMTFEIEQFIDSFK